MTTAKPKRPGGLLAFCRHDGGRAAAGFKGTAGDCVTRAIAIATGRPYADVYAALNAAATKERPGARARKQKGKRSSARTGIFWPTVRRYMESIGWVWVPTMQIGSGCKVHLRADELPAGRLVVNVSRHCVAVLDGVLYDTEDSSRDGKRCVYGYYRKATTLDKAAHGYTKVGGALMFEGPDAQHFVLDRADVITDVLPGMTTREQAIALGKATLAPGISEAFKYLTPFDRALAKVRADLEWRGPSGRKAGHVVLDRTLAAALIGYEEREP